MKSSARSLPSAPASPDTRSATWSASAAEPTAQPVGCIDVSVGGYKAPDYGCLSQQMSDPEQARARQKNQEDRKSTRLNSSHTEIYTLSLHDALPIWLHRRQCRRLQGAGLRLPEPADERPGTGPGAAKKPGRSEEHTSELQSHRDLHSFPTRRSSDLVASTSVSAVTRRRTTAA